MDDILKQAARGAVLPIEDAGALPFEAYTCRDIFEQECEKLFLQDWLFVGTTFELEQAGDYIALSVGEEPVLVIRGADKRLRCLSNVCRHRGALLVPEGTGRLKDDITCPYHAWNYNSAGELVTVPYQGDVTLDKEQHCLPEFHIETWYSFVFISLADQPESLNAKLGWLKNYLVGYQPGRFDHGHSFDNDIWQCNWKVAFENAIESYHLFKVHPQTLGQYSNTEQAYYIAGSPQWTLTGGAMKPNSKAGKKRNQSTEFDIYQQYVLISIPPSFVAVLSYESLDWMAVLPMNEGSTMLRSGSIWEGKPSYLSMFSSGSAEEKSNEEDRQICELVQKGMKSRKTQGGKLVELERILVDFHQYWAARVCGLPVPGEHREPIAERFLAPVVDEKYLV